MLFQRPYTFRLQARIAQPRDRVVVVTEDPGFWVGLRDAAPDLDSTWILAHTAREGLLAVEDSRVVAVVLDGALNDKPANQLLQLLKQIRPTLPIVFAFQEPTEQWEREARQAGVLFYGDRARYGDMAGVVRQCLRRVVRVRPRSGELPSRGVRG